MKKDTLSNRLQSVCAFIKPGAVVADVGTDHGYLPAHLAAVDPAARLIAADIKKGPLDRARRTARDAGVYDRISFIQTDGLIGISGIGVDHIVLAGLGGEVMIKILSEAPWTRCDAIRLILQPQSKADVLISWLHDSGYDICDAVLAEDGGRIYLVMLAGGQTESTHTNPLNILLHRKDPLLPEYLMGQLEKTERALSGLSKATRSQGGARASLEKKLDELNRFKKETDAW
ncbi:SAM-dependent methyltransferase [Oscillospiraceae bacterium CM]|nr:SAM-dependent methyltransferase [Oscillospiraceae bacterium CM]